MMGVFIPESAKFLMARGRREEAQRIMARFGSGIRRVAQDASGTARAAAAPLSGRAVIGKLAALSLTAPGWGFVHFGLLLWRPVERGARGHRMEVSSPRQFGQTLGQDRGCTVGVICG